MRKNTSNFSLDRFIVELEKSQQDFNATAKQLQRWANTSIAHVNVKELLDTIMKSERKAEKMNILYNQEVANRGRGGSLHPTGADPAERACNSWPRRLFEPDGRRHG